MSNLRGKFTSMDTEVAPAAYTRSLRARQITANEGRTLFSGIYPGLPQLGLKFSVIESALLGLVLNEAAYLAEIIRGGILGVPVGQTQAARALGLNSFQVMTYVVLPQATRIIIPALGNSVNGLLKTTSVTSVISMEELLRKTQILIQEKFMVLELFAVAAIYYLLMTSVWDIIQHRIELRFGRAYKTITLTDGH